MSEYVPYKYNKKTMLIDRYIILGEMQCETSDYNIYDMSINPFALKKIDDIMQNGYNKYGQQTELSPHYMNIYNNQHNSNNKKIFLYTEVYSQNATKIIIQSISDKYAKLWVNGTCLSIHHYDWLHAYYITAELKKGKNIFLFEHYSPREGALFSLQIRNYQFEQSNDIRALANLGNAVQINQLTLINDPVYNITDSIYRFMYTKNENTEYENKFRIDILDSVSGLVKRQYAKIDEPVEIDINELRSVNEEVFRYEWIGCTFKRKNGKKLVTAVCVFLKDFKEKAIAIGEKALLYAKELQPEAYHNIVGLQKRQKLCADFNDYNNLFWLTTQLKDITSQIESGNYPYDLYTTPGKPEFYIHSDLDDSNIRILAYIPPKYDSSKKYPVILALATGNDGGYCYGPLEDNLSEPCLCFDVTGRGFTGGSYIGEASILEVLQWIKNHYLIDEDRIYLLGQSNGGYASYSISQNHPHLAAAVFPHISNPNVKTLENLSNVPVYQTVSSRDYVFAGHENDVKKIINKYGNYHQYNFDDMLHLNFAPYVYHKQILKNMLECIRNSYPKKIIFRTERNRHLDSFWIRLHGICRGRKTAEVKAEIVNERLIEISLRNSHGVTITLPPQIDKSRFTIIINGRSIDVDNCTNNKVILCKKRTWILSDTEIPVDFRKGTGLLDVYLNSMRIIIPEGTSETLHSIAENFARPYSNGMDPVIHVNYPIFEDNCTPDHIMSYNLIIVDINKSNKFVNRFSDKLAVDYDDLGYEYKGIKTNTPYLILQSIPNPYDPRRTFLIISTNNNKFFHNLFIRRVIIPYYASGIHPYWNNEVLIYDGEKYKRIYERGTDIEDIG